MKNINKLKQANFDCEEAAFRSFVKIFVNTLFLC